ncbi:hypothetical protein HW555_011455 [Spodoptera exigua]|uniref:Uncharacterized protein n=1 Tax=Spodoptera exigua TaxID=7107 RepID=A0A835KYU6_SPOEX|nr:hypothetical protein HW555_011455 [Spodoptera exigua]
MLAKQRVSVAMAQPEASAVESSTAEAEAPTPAPPAAPHTMNTYRKEAAHSATTAFHNERVRTSTRAGTLPDKPPSPEFASFRKHSNFSNKVTICCSKFSSDMLNACSPILKRKSKTRNTIYALCIFKFRSARDLLTSTFVITTDKRRDPGGRHSRNAGKPVNEASEWKQAGAPHMSRPPDTCYTPPTRPALSARV